MIDIYTNHPNLRFSYKETLRTLQHVYTGERKSLPALAIVFTHNRFIKTINKKFLNHDYYTDVIAFSLGSGGGVEAELYVNLDAARTQADEYGVTFTQEAKRLLIHGALHLIGYNDKTENERENMHVREDKYLAKLEKK
jgi:probable rRNA maturation factor